MHFPIVQLSEKKLNKDEWITSETMSEDYVIRFNTDYIGDRYTDEKRKELIKNHLSYIFKGIGTVDVENETVTLLSKDEINTTLKEEVENAIEAIREYTEKYFTAAFYPFRHHGENYKNCYTIFWNDYGAKTSASFMEDTPFYEGATFYIGAVYDAHI